MMNKPSSSSSLNIETNYCRKYNETVKDPKAEEKCNGAVNSCVLFWELNDVKNKSLDEIRNSSVIQLKGCWVGHKISNDYCVYKIEPKHSIYCYCKGNNCNDNMLPDLNLISQLRFNNSSELKEPLPSTQTNQSFLFIYLIPILILFGLIFAFLYKQCHKFERRFKSLSNQSHINGANKSNHLNNNINIESQEPLLNGKLKPKAKIIEQIRQGQYGCVYKGKLEKTTAQQSTEQLHLVHPGQLDNNSTLMVDLEQYVAIKAYPLHAYESFKHEFNVYNLPQIKHKNILQYIMADEKRTSSTSIEYWLVLEYYENGSLYDYLKRNLITHSQLLNICLDIATGLAHLHNNNNSFIIVHRDIKSKNILLKSDLTACISDFNLALILYPNQPATENLGQVGTIRYMSPEVLDCAIQFSNDGLMKIDIYSTSLVFWECLSRCSAHQLNGTVEPYLPPYEKELGSYMTKEKLRKHVSENKRRPQIPDHWCDHSDLKEFSKTITECWDSDAEARLTASGIVERLKRIIRK